jgi:RNA recognition motif-containing protein
MTIYVGNISHSANEQDIEQLFSQYGEVSSVKLIKDHETGRPRGFGFIEMDEQEGQEAIDQLNEYEFMSRALVVNAARPRTDRPRQGGGGGFNRNFSRGGERDSGRDRGGYNKNY